MQKTLVRQISTVSTYHAYEREGLTSYRTYSPHVFYTFHRFENMARLKNDRPEVLQDVLTKNRLLLWRLIEQENLVIWVEPQHQNQQALTKRHAVSVSSLAALVVAFEQFHRLFVRRVV